MEIESWIETTIGEQATLQRGIDITKAEQRAGNVPVISSGGVSSYHDTAAVKGPGVVLGRKGVVGSVYYIEEDYWPHDTTLWVKDFHHNHRRFVFYFFRSIALRLARMDVGSANPTLNRNHVHPMPVVWPPLTEQKAIAEVLGALDNKIELNRRMNETLWAMARSLFQSWFVDFDLCKGTDPLTAPEFRKLYPTDLLETAEGSIPKGWKTRSLDEMAVYLNGLALQKYPANDGPTLPVIKIAQLRKGNTEGADQCSAGIPPDYIIQDGDVLFSWSGSLEVELWCGGTGALNQHLFKVTSQEFPKWFYFLWTRHHLETFRRIAASKATTMGHIQRRHLTEAKVLVPPRELIQAMSSIMKPLIDKIIANRVQSRTLAELRDTLLPKLLSGEVSVKPLIEAAA